MNDAAIKAEAIKTAKEWVARDPLYLDTETTGTHAEAEIIEFSIVDHSGAAMIDTLVKPTVSIPESATKIHGIDDCAVDISPTWLGIWPKILPIIKGRFVCIYNANFDLRLIKQSHAQSGMAWSSVGGSAVCAMLLYARFYGEWSDYHRTYSWQSLEKAGEQCSIALPNSHRAKDDALLARQVLLCMANGVES